MGGIKEVGGLVSAGKVAGLSHRFSGRTYRALPHRTVQGARVLLDIGNYAGTGDTGCAGSAIVIGLADMSEVHQLHAACNSFGLPLAPGVWHQIVTD